MAYMLTIDITGRVVIRGDGRSVTLNSVDDYNTFLVNEAAARGLPITMLRVLASSSMDFPHEYTNDVAVVTLARALRP